MTPEKLAQLAETRFDIKATKQTLLERVDAKCTFTHRGGLFKATPQLMAEIAGLQKCADWSGAEVIMLDEFQNPIQVSLIEFQKEAFHHYQYALNAYLNEYKKLKKVRKGDKL